MADTEVASPVVASPAKTQKKVKAAKGDAKKPKKPSTHPPVNDMVLAIKTLRKRNGLSQATRRKKANAVPAKCQESSRNQKSSCSQTIVAIVENRG